MLIPRFAVMMFSVAVMVLVGGTACGQDYPTKPVRIVCSGIGGGSDLVARIMAQGIAGPLRQPVTVENRGGDVLQATVVYQAPPDGYTLLVYANPLWIAPFLQKTPYDPVKSFATITLITRAPNILVVHPSLPVKSVKELIALAKARPGELNYASGATGGPSHLLGELFKAMAGVNIVRIPYKSGSLQMVDLLAGQVQLTVDGASTLMPHIKSGRLRALAVTTAQPSTLTPGLPTMSASGLRGYEGASVYGAWAPAATPVPIIQRLNQEMVRFLNQPDVKQKFLDAGLETVGSSPEEFAAFIESDMVPLHDGMVEEDIASVVGKDRVLGVVTDRLGVDLPQPGYAIRHLTADHPTTFIVGELNTTRTERLDETVQLLSHAAGTIATDDIWGFHWSKLPRDCTRSPMTTLAGADVGVREAADSALIRRLSIGVIAEVVRVGLALGNKIKAETLMGIEPDLWLKAGQGERFDEVEKQFLAASNLITLPPGVTSMARHMAKRRRTEIDYLNGYVVEKGRELGIPTPLNAAVTRSIREMEQGRLQPGLQNIERILAQA